jgi:hypothetical protein
MDFERRHLNQSPSIPPYRRIVVQNFPTAVHLSGPSANEIRLDVDKLGETSVDVPLLLEQSIQPFRELFRHSS